MLADQGLDCTTRSDFNPYRYKAPRIIDLPLWEKNERIHREPTYGHMVCRCEKVSEQEIREAVKGGARTLDEIKYKTLAGFGRCQGGFCTSRVIKIMAEELAVSPLELTKKGRDSHILSRETKSFREEDERRLT
jgi:glycerol-3-phosphate dehydrogenase